MKIPLLFALLALSVPWNAVARDVVVASTAVLEFQPTAVGRDSPPLKVRFFNRSREVVVVHGLGAAGPFGNFAWECDGDPSAVTIQPRGKCVLSVTFQPRDADGPGLAEGIVGFRLSTGTIITDLRGFSYAREPLAGVRNMIASVEPLGFRPPFSKVATGWLKRIEARLLDGNARNDRTACPVLAQLGRRAEHEAARRRVSEWSAVALVMQADAVSKRLGCRFR